MKDSIMDIQKEQMVKKKLRKARPRCTLSYNIITHQHEYETRGTIQDRRCLRSTYPWRIYRDRDRH
jgi:hypothetical protein